MDTAIARLRPKGEGSWPDQYRQVGEVRVGDRLQLKNDGGDFPVGVLALSERRGPAVAQRLYQETKASRELRLKSAEERRAMPHFRCGKASAIAVKSSSFGVERDHRVQYDRASTGRFLSGEGATRS